jgi:hypothetical protein
MNNNDEKYLNMTEAELEALSPEDFQEAFYAFNRQAAAETEMQHEAAQNMVADDSMSIEESREQLRRHLEAEAEAERQQAANEAANQFVREHDEFIPCPENLAAFTSYLDAKKLDVRSVEDLEIVYAELRKQNALKLDPEKLAEERAAKRNARFVAEALRESRATEATDLSNLSPEDAGRRYTEWAANEKQLQLRRSGLSTK